MIEKGLLFFTVSLVAVWLLVDEFTGGERITRMAEYFTGSGDATMQPDQPTDQTIPGPTPGPSSPDLSDGEIYV